MKMHFRFSDPTDAETFYNKTFWGFAFTGTDSVSKHIRKQGTHTVTIVNLDKSNYIFLVVMAANYDSFVSTELISSDGTSQ